MSKVPTLDDLKEIYKINNYEYGPNEVLLKEVIKVLQVFPGFHKYLIKTNFDYFELPTVVFGSLIDYMYELFQASQTDEIKEILNYLEQLTYSKDRDIHNLLFSGALEVFDKHLDILPELVELMPEHLKSVFLEHF